MSVEFPYGRLFIGWRSMDWSKCYYEPAPGAVGAESDTRAPDLFVYESPTADGDGGVRNPLASEINWLPHFDYRGFEAQGNVGKHHMHRWFVYRAWEHLKTKDGSIDQVRRDNQFAASGKYQRWESWVVHADRWRRAHPRGPKDPDDGYESGGDDMPPPPRPNGPRGGPRGGPRCRRGGGGAAVGKRKAPAARTNGVRPVQKKSKSTPSSSSASSSGRQSESGLFMSGGLNGVAHSHETVDVSSDDESEDINDDFSDRHPTEAPQQGPRPYGSSSLNTPPPTGQPGRLGGSLPRNLSGRLGSRRTSANGDAEDSDEDEREQPRTPTRLSLRPVAPITEQEHEELPAGDEQRQRLMSEVNGEGMDEDEALQRAIRDSVAPEDRHGRQNGDVAMPDGARRSIENDEEDGEGEE